MDVTQSRKELEGVNHISFNKYAISVHLSYLIKRLTVFYTIWKFIFKMRNWTKLTSYSGYSCYPCYSSYSSTVTLATLATWGKVREAGGTWQPCRGDSHRAKQERLLSKLQFQMVTLMVGLEMCSRLISRNEQKFNLIYCGIQFKVNQPTSKILSGLWLWGYQSQGRGWGRWWGCLLWRAAPGSSSSGRAASRKRLLALVVVMMCNYT